ncbi:Acetyl CoA synthetase-like protein [Teratosphaeria destructans]|uniref:Acetyl CoA synthetase-like protein n=1 Tax=Teratosphaeria destructans TaxID=418781 RepID=A0A9W7SWH5_9PEZI|nr:Acetyl CoA synthetase-like protein [Teratosphaeria destructans]
MAPLSIAFGRKIETTDISHLQLWQESVNARPNAPALIAKHQRPDGFRWVGSQHREGDYLQWTYAELDRAARRLATTLNQLTHVERRPIVTLVNSQAEWALFFWAAAYLHSPLVPINPKTATRSEEITHMLRMTNPAAILTANPELANQLEDSVPSNMLAAVPVKLLASRTCSTKLGPGWLQLSDVMSGEPSPPHTPDVVDAKDTILILFTSGTTSLPKPCNLSSFMCVNAALGNVEARNLSPAHRFVQHLPNFHSYGIGWSLAFWLAGATVVLPSENFEAQASLECFEKFRATHMSLVPTTAQAMLAHPYFAKADLSTLICVDVSGAGVLPSVLDACTHGMKVPAFSSYGMTESPNTLIWPDGSTDVIRHGEVLSGKPVRGTCVKICEPGSKKIVPRGQIGELHNGGVQVIHGYADPTVKSDNFYVDESGTRWIMTGDQAVMEDDGAVRICGRYKDMIIRGGENISPASIEDYLERQPGVHVAQVVGVPDEMAGEVPIAIVTTKEGQTVNKGDLKRATSDDLGPAFAPKLVLHLRKDLGLEDFPKTASGKVRKVELRMAVREYLKKQEAAQVNNMGPTIDTLIQIWQTISGTDGLEPTSGLETFSDSLMMMQLSSMVKKQLLRDITVEDFKLCETIQDQADLIDTRPVAGVKVSTKPVRQGPPTIHDMPFLGGDEAAFESTKQLVSSTISQNGLSWDDVEDVMPLPDWDAIFCHVARPSSWNLRFSWHCPASVRKLEAAVMESLNLHPTLRSTAVVDPDTGKTLLIPIRNNEKWLKLAITTGHEVETADHLRQLLLDHPQLDCASMPGPLVRIHIANVWSDGSSGLVFIGSHATNDMSMTKLWLDDVANLLTGEATPVPHALFKDFANAYHAHRYGTEADNGIEYWTKKHAGISTIPESTYWPPQRAAEWFKGIDNGWTRWDGTKARKGERSTRTAEKRKAQKGLRRMVKVDDIAKLKSEHNVPVFMLVKAAIALMNIKQTGGKEAIFGTINAARTWPFCSDYTPSEREQCSGNPLDVSGCTTEYVLDRIPVGHASSVVSFMQFVTKDEEQNSAFAHTPFYRIVDRLRDPLGPTDTRTWADRERDAEAILPLIRRQSFNWLPTAPNANANPNGLTMLEMLTRMDNGLTITGFLGDDKKSVCVGFSWDAEHLSYREAEKALNELVEIVDRMGKEENWELSVGELLRT